MVVPRIVTTRTQRPTAWMQGTVSGADWMIASSQGGLMRLAICHPLCGLRALIRVCRVAVPLKPVDDKACLPRRPCGFSGTKRVFVLAVGLFCFFLQAVQ